MHGPLCGKLLNICPPAAIIDNAAVTFAAVDTIGARFARFRFQLGALDIAFATPPKIQESDDDGSTDAYADITGATLSAISATKDNKLYQISIPIHGGRKRYLKAVATAGDGAAGTYIAATCELFYGENQGQNATDCGLEEWVSLT